jgi:glycosyltransferase involved in cell wall biosynthesis
MEITILIPAYNEEESIPELYHWLTRVLQTFGKTYEILFVDDGSSDQTWAAIKTVGLNDPHVRGIRFNRNYGKSAALQTGFRACQGEVVITMDSDLQDSPDEIPDLYRMITEEGYDLVSGWKRKRYDPISKTIPSKLFNRVTQSMSGIKLHDFNCGLKAYKGKVVKAIEVYGEMHRYIPVIAKWNGFSKIGEKEVEHRARKYGVTKFGLERFVFGFLDLISIMFVSKFRKRPMHFFGSFGTILFLFGGAVAFWLTAVKFYHGMTNTYTRDVTAQPLFFLALTAVIVGSQMFLAGFLGELVSQGNTRKNEYLIAEQTGF